MSANLISLAEKATAVLSPLESWKHRCHEASLALVMNGIGTRVARGFCRGAGIQHSWVVVGNNCYARDALIIDATLWSYDPSVHGVWVGKASKRPHVPHGAGNIWQWGKPTSSGEEEIKLSGLSSEAESFLDMLGPLDFRGWHALLSQAPVGGWPSKEIMTAAFKSHELKTLIPIDRVGMVTDLNPGGLYLKGVEESMSNKQLAMSLIEVAAQAGVSWIPIPDDVWADMASVTPTVWRKWYTSRGFTVDRPHNHLFRDENGNQWRVSQSRAMERVQFRQNR